MKSKIFFYSLLSSLIILFVFNITTQFVAAQNSTPGGGQASPASTTSPCMGIKNKSALKVCQSQQSILSKAKQVCANIDTANFPDQDSCLYSQATEYKSTLVCQQIQNQDSQNSCLSDIYVAKRNLAGCKSFSSQAAADQCYSNYARVTKNPKICKNIKGSTTSDSCYKAMESVFSSVALCKNIADSVPGRAAFMDLPLERRTPPIVNI
jgi:hypothetical protein